MLFDPGDIVITESPRTSCTTASWPGNGTRVLTVPMDDDGMITDGLEQLLERLDRAGELRRREAHLHRRLLPEPDRPDALRRTVAGTWSRSPSRYADRHRILILEDAAYRELRYDGDDLPSVKSFDPSNEYVIYAGTFSKPCAPGLKTGYALMPPDLIEPLCT